LPADANQEHDHQLENDKPHGGVPEFNAEGLVAGILEVLRQRAGDGPQNANLVFASRECSRFVRSPDSSRLLTFVNKAAALQYAPTISADKLTLYFTRFDRHSVFKGPQIYRATRPGIGRSLRPTGASGWLGRVCRRDGLLRG